jgi:hypothetical protein
MHVAHSFSCWGRHRQTWQSFYPKKGKKTMRKAAISIMLILANITFTYTTATASNKFRKEFNARYNTSGQITYKKEKAAIGSCLTCHSAGKARNRYGEAFKKSEFDFAAIETLDSDGDGVDNVTEIKAGTFPSDPNSKPSTN